MEKHLPDSIFVFEVKELCCMPCIETKKRRLLECPGIMEVDADLEKQIVKIKGNIHVVELISMFQKIYVNADLINYKKERREEHDQRKESCGKKGNDCSGEKDNGCSDHDELEDIGADCHEKHNQRKESRGKKEKECSWNDDETEDIFKEHNQRKVSRGKKEKECSWNDDETEDIGPDHYKLRNTFKDHKPEAYVPPSKEYYWGDVGSGMHKKFPMIPGADSWYTLGFPNYHVYNYPAPWPQGDYM